MAEFVSQLGERFQERRDDKNDITAVPMIPWSAPSP
jgi:hypothetical protein